MGAADFSGNVKHPCFIIFCGTKRHGRSRCEGFAAFTSLRD